MFGVRALQSARDKIVAERLAGWGRSTQMTRPLEFLSSLKGADMMH